MENRAYLQHTPWWSTLGGLDEIPVEKFIWTGRMQFKTVNGLLTVYVERRVTFLGIRLGTTWEHEDYFKFYEVDVAILECSSGN